LGRQDFRSHQPLFAHRDNARNQRGNATNRVADERVRCGLATELLRTVCGWQLDADDTPLPDKRAALMIRDR